VTKGKQVMCGGSLSQLRVNTTRAFNMMKFLLMGVSMTSLVACSVQEGANTSDSSINPQASGMTTIAMQDNSGIPIRNLLSNLALAYPSGVLPAERAAAAAIQLAQNPAVLKYSAPKANAAISYSPTAFNPQAAISYTVGLYSQVQRAQNTNLFGSYFFSIYLTEMTSALASNPKWNLEGTAFYASLGINPGLSPVYRFRNVINGSYLYTINNGEKNDIIANYGNYFSLEGTAWYASSVPVPGFSPLYRFRNLTNGTYLFSAYEEEKNGIIANYSGIFLYEGISYYVRQAVPIELTLLAGNGGDGYANGPGGVASFSRLYGMVHDSAGNIFATDFDNHIIRKISPEGEVSNFAGLAGAAGSANGVLSVARFNNPVGIVIDSANNMYVADGGNNVIRKISPAGIVSDFAGASGTEGDQDATGTAATFRGPRGLAFDSAGNLYVADRYNSTIRKISSSGAVTTLAGVAGSPGFANGSGSSVRFNQPVGVVVDSTGTLLVTDSLNNVIRKVTQAGEVSTFAGSPSSAPGSADGLGTAAGFNYPYGIALGSSDTVYVTDHTNNTVRKITAAGEVSTVVGTAGSTAAFAEGLLPSVLDPGKVTTSVRVHAGDLYIGTKGRILKVNGLP
jgi:sugar lactone lactonase YvrE